MSSQDSNPTASMPDPSTAAPERPDPVVVDVAGPAGASNGQAGQGWHYSGGASYDARAFVPQPFPGPVVAEAGEEAGGMDYAGLWMAFRRRWPLAVGLGIVAAVACAAAVWMLLPPAKYLAHSMLHVSSVTEQVLGGAGETRQTFDNYQRSQIVMVKSRPVLNAALRKANVAELSIVQQQADAVEWLEKELTADYKEGPEFLTIALKGDRPEELLVLVNAITETYLQDVVRKEDNRRMTRMDRLKELHAKFDETLRNKQAILTNLAKQFDGSTEPLVNAEKHKYALGTLNQAQMELLRDQSSLRSLTVEYGVLKAKEKGLGDVPVPDSAVEEALDKDPVIQKELERAAGLERLLKEIERAAVQGRQEPYYKKTEGVLKEVKAAIAERRSKLRPDLVAKGRRKFVGDFQRHVFELEQRIELVRANEKELIELVDRLAKDTKKTSHGSLDVEAVKAEVSQAADMTKRLSNQIEALNVELMAPPRVEKLQDAIITKTKDRIKQIAATAGAGMGGFALLVFGISWWEFRARRVNSVEEAVRGLGLRLVGVLPALQNRRLGRAGQAAGSQEHLWNNQLTESVDTTRTMVLHAAHGNNLRAVMVTSALPGEGKTSLSSQLAASMARSGRKTLLIDGDMRNPAGHQLFNFPVGPGLSEVLRGEAEVGAAVRQTPIRGMWLLPAGQWSHKTAEALAEKGVGAILQPLRQQFDFIVIDSSPVLAVVDALLIGQSADAVLLSILREVSRMPAIQAAYQRLHMLGIQMLGCVVNGTAPNDHLYGGASGYGYGYGYGSRPAAPAAEPKQEPA